MEEVFSPLPNTKKYINSKYNDYNPDENTDTVVKKGWGDRMCTGQEQFSDKKKRSCSLQRQHGMLERALEEKTWV